MTALLRALWTTARNQPITEGGISRRDMWHITRPCWTHTILTTEASCGCRKRFGLRRVIICADHLFGPRMGGAS